MSVIGYARHGTTRRHYAFGPQFTRLRTAGCSRIVLDRAARHTAAGPATAVFDEVLASLTVGDVLAVTEPWRLSLDPSHLHEAVVRLLAAGVCLLDVTYGRGYSGPLDVAVLDAMAEQHWIDYQRFSAHGGRMMRRMHAGRGRGEAG